MASANHSIIEAMIADQYTHVVDSAGPDGILYHDARDKGEDEFARQVQNAEIVLDEDDIRAFYRATYAKVDKSQNKQALKLIRQTIEWGMDSIPGIDNPLFLTVVTVGRGMPRKSLGNITPDDFEAMYQERVEGKQKVDAALESDEPIFRTGRSLVLPHGTWRMAAVSGAFIRPGVIS